MPEELNHIQIEVVPTESPKAAIILGLLNKPKPIPPKPSSSYAQYVEVKKSSRCIIM